MRRKITFFFALTVVFALFMSNAAYAAEGSGVTVFTDMPADWSTAALQSAVGNGLLTGDNGRIRAGDNLTRAEMAAVINRAFGAYTKASLAGFTDVPESAWYHDDMALAVQMRTFLGSGNGKLEPDTYITREQTFSILTRALKLSGADKSVLNKFSDSGLISNWAEGYVASLVKAGYVEGSDGKLNPLENITRAEFAKLMDNVLKTYIKQAGTYSEDIEGNVMVNVPGVILKDMKISGDLIIGDGVGEGEVTLDSVIVTGRTVIRGGGQNSIKIIGSSNTGTVIVARIDGVVCIKVQGDAKIDVIYVEDGSDDVIVVGSLADIQLNADNVTVTATSASISKVQISGSDSKVIVGLGSDVGAVDVTGCNASISGQGTVKKVEVLAGGDNASITTANTKIAVDEDAKNVTGGGGEVLKPGDSGVNNTKGSALVKEEEDQHEEQQSQTALTSIGAISGTAKVGETLTRGTLSPSGAAASYQWMVCDTVNGEYVNIAGKTGTSFTIPEGYAGKFIKVKATGTNNYTGTVTSPATSAVVAGFSITASAGGDAYINGAEATSSAAITVTGSGGTLDTVEVKGINKSSGAALTVSAELNTVTGKYEFDATGLKDGTLTIVGTSIDSVEAEATLTLDTIAAKLVTGGKMVELTGSDNPLSVVQVSNWAFPAVGDINGDGALDVVVGDMSGHITTYYGQANGTYVLADSNPLGFIETGMYTFPGLGDLDRDGDLDLIVSLETGYVQYYENTGTVNETTGTVTEPLFVKQEGENNPFAAVFNPYYAFNAVGCVNDDTYPDVLFGYGDNNLSTLALELWVNDGTGGFTKDNGTDTWFSNITKSDGFDFVVPYLGDFNGDGKLDAGVYKMSYSSPSDRKIYFYQGDGSGGFVLNEEQNPFAGISVNVPFAAAGDFDNDKDSDFLIGDQGGTIRYFTNSVGEAVRLSEDQIIGGSGTANVTTDDTNSFLLSGKGAESLAKIAVYVNGNLLADEIQADESGAWSLTWLGTEEGFEIAKGESYSITVKQTDVAGNVSDISDFYVITVRDLKD
ncbi:MAG: S-layer homology domain-containing protein [Clostridiaceae bacterium]|nr:S-layer homology domain-containing protein [Clostridiaceae bacterium]